MEKCWLDHWPMWALSVLSTFAAYGRFPKQIRAQLYSSFFTYELHQRKIIPTTNTHGKTRTQVWADLDLDDFLNLMEIFLSMEVYEIDGPRRMYWNTEGTNFFPAMNYRKIMSRSRFEDLMRHMQLSFAKRW